MSKGLRITLVTIGVIVAVAGLLLVGINLGRVSAVSAGIWPFGTGETYWPQLTDPGSMMGYGMPGGYGRMGSGATGGYGYGMMGPGMMGGYGMMGPGTADGYSYGMMGQVMMGGYGAGQLLGVEPLTIDEASSAVEDYLDAIGASDLEIGEVMVFDNHAYVQVEEADSGFGAIELLVDPVTQSVYPEYGPNMMWNLKYGMMGGFGARGMMGGYGTGGMMGMMGGPAYGYLPSQVDQVDQFDPSNQPVDAEQAVQIAQDYLDDYLPGAEAEEHADAFYGYYTIHVLRDGDTVGMLSVNGLTGQVWLHNWHGDLIEVSEHE